jgi:hypothetical protein
MLRRRSRSGSITHQMRTTLDIDPEVLQAAKELARRDGRTAGEVLSDLARAGLRAAMAAPSFAGQDKPPSSFFGFRPFSPRGTPVTHDLVNKLRDESGV